MVRIIGFLVGLAFAGVLLISFGVNLVGTLREPAEATAEEDFHRHPKALNLASDGLFGKFDRQQVQRGFQVYKEVCAACHSLHLVALRHPSALILPPGGRCGKCAPQRAKRGFQVYKEVCAACHSLHLVAFRDLHALGYSAAEVKAIASQWATETPSVNAQ